MRFPTALQLAALAGALALGGRSSQAADKPAPVPTGAQSDGPFHKVILDADRDLDGDGTVDDVILDPLEIAVAPDGRVFFIERAGVVKVWKPETKSTVVAGRLEVFNELEDGLRESPWIRSSR